jgi:hypothetical protein
LALVAIAETNAYLTYMDLKKLTSAQYSHGDFKMDLERAATIGGGQEEPGRVLRSEEQVEAGGGLQSGEHRCLQASEGIACSAVTPKTVNA